MERILSFYGKIFYMIRIRHGNTVSNKRFMVFSYLGYTSPINEKAVIILNNSFFINFLRCNNYFHGFFFSCISEYLISLHNFR